MNTPAIWEPPESDALPGGMTMPATVGLGRTTGRTVVPGETTISGSRPFAIMLPSLVGIEFKAKRLGELDQLFGAVTPEYSGALTPDSAGSPEPEEVRERIVSLRKHLRLTADQTAAIVGLKPRRLYEIMAGSRLPESRVESISDRIAVIESLARQDARAARALVQGRLAETAEHLAHSRWQELRELFNEARNAWLAIRPTGPASIDPIEQSASRASEVADVISAPGFEVTLNLLRWLGRTDATQERLGALLALSRTLEAIETGDETDEAYDFVYGLDEGARQDFQSRALDALRSDGFDQAAWQEFLAREDDAARTGSRAVELEPLDESTDGYLADEDPLPWQTDLQDTDFRLHDRRAR